MKKKDYLYILILMMIPLILIWGIVPEGKLFGHNVDWLNQHVMIGDALRHAIRKEGTLFPTYLSNLMGGVNIYHFSYYGYLRPDILFGTLFPQLAMIDIIIGYSLFLMILSGISCYLFLRYQYHNKEICLFISILILLSSLFFQSHKQITFVNYLPFLFLALLSIDIYIKKENLTLFVLWGSLIVIHSYYYSIGCFLICLIYFINKAWLNKQLSWRYFFKFIRGFIFIVLITAILTVPTLFVIANNSKNVTSTGFASLFQATLDLQGLLYNNYGCGLSYLSWILIVLGFNNQKTRILSAMTMLAMTCPIISYIFNGFLYARSKILIVFIPLIAYIMCEVITQIVEHKIQWKSISFFLIAIPIFFINKTVFVMIDCMICLSVIFTSYRHKYVYFLYLLVPILVVYQTNPSDQFLDQKTYKSIISKDKTQLIERYQDRMIRLSDFENNNQTVNDSFALTVQKASGYTSTNHSLYNQFLYDTLHLPISINNRVANQDNSHIFYQGMMSINTIMTQKKIPVGYSLLDKKNKYQLYQNQNVMPLAYASDCLYNEEKFQKLNFPQSLDTLYNNVIVKDGTSNYQSQFVDENLGFQNSYHIENKQKQTVTKTIQRTTQNEILVIEFDIQNNRPHQAVDITIEGIKNKLTKSNHPYYNDNTHFTYVLSHHDNIEQLKITLSQGNYDIKNIKCSSLSYDVIKNRCHEVDTMTIKKGQDVLNGDIDVSHDGYFVTNIPYSQGYTIYIDQKKVSSEIVNTTFLGCQIKAGHHQIKVTFEPPGYQFALFLSAIGTTFTLCHWIYERKKKHEKKYKRTY